MAQIYTVLLMCSYFNKKNPSKNQ